MASILEMIKRKSKRDGKDNIKFSKLLKAKSIDEFEGDEEYMEAVGKLEELVMDPDFAGAYDKGAKTEWLLEDMQLTVRNERNKYLVEKKKVYSRKK